MPTEKANIVLDASKIDLFETCPERFNYRHNHNKTLPQKAKPLDAGSLAHNGFEVYFKSLAEGQHFNDRMNSTLMKMRELSSNPDECQLEPEDAEILMSAVEQSCHYWRHEDETFEILAVEEAFARVIYEDEYIRIILTGKIDLLVNKPAIGRNAGYTRLPIDHKTFSRDSEILSLNNQFCNYTDAVGSNFLFVNRVGLQKTVEPDKKFRRIPLSYDPIFLQMWRNNISRMVIQEFLACVEHDYWPMKPTSCLKFNRLCEYYRVCSSSGKQAKEFKLLTEFIDAPNWDVSAKMEGQS